ncbi:MAG: sigma-54-dependent Fis family transcriptional regulator [Calditrichaeota bacterium]|nr:MAG: sigma-54-dependent Fis family transcriptional regulator [Calditrichota bacterium]
MLRGKSINILLIEDEAFDVRRVHNTIKPFENRLKIKDVVSDGHSALELLERNRGEYDVVIMDFQIAGSLTGENLIKEIKRIDEAIQIIVVTKMTVNITDFDFANRLIEAGAMWYCTKYPGDIEEYIYQPTDFILSLFNAYERRKLHKEKNRSNRKLSQNIAEILEEKKIIGQSEPIENLRQQIQKCAETDTTILIRGASGTGKELVAANIHYRSSRCFEKFIAINCGSLPHELIESELFGYEKGAFTGAQDKKPGLFEVANKGTIFLDEVAELPPAAQVKLLRVIQEGEIDKIGRTEKVKVDVRIIAASNKDIEKEVKEKRFREDLYYRLNVVPLWIPPLNERPEDIPLLIDFFMEKFCREMGREKPRITEDGKSVLLEYSWPGNVRELQNVVQRLLFFGEPVLSREQMERALGISPSHRSSQNFPLTGIFESEAILPLREVEKRVRKEYIKYVRKQVNSDAEAARLLGLAPPNYHRICKELGLK